MKKCTNVCDTHTLEGCLYIFEIKNFDRCSGAKICRRQDCAGQGRAGQVAEEVYSKASYLSCLALFCFCFTSHRRQDTQYFAIDTRICM